MDEHSRRETGQAKSSASRMRCNAYRVIRRPEYRNDLDAIEAWIALDNASAAIDMWPK